MANNQPLTGSIDANSEPQVTRAQLRRQRRKEKRSNGGAGNNNASEQNVTDQKTANPKPKDKKPNKKSNKKPNDSKKKKPKTPKVRKPRQKVNVSEWLSDTTAAVLGAKDFATSRFGAEDIQRDSDPILTAAPSRLATEDELRNQSEARLGYGAAIIDLMKLRVEQFYYLVLWVSGQRSQDVINRAVGSNYSTYHEQLIDPQWFGRGYQTAATQFVMAIVGDDRDESSTAAIPTLERKLETLTPEQQANLANSWFKHFNNNLQGRNPERKLRKAGDKNPKKTEIDENNKEIATFINREMTNSFLKGYKLEPDGDPVLGDYHYGGQDFTYLLDAKLKKQLEFQNLTSLTNAINRFVNQPIQDLLGVVAPMAFYDALYRMATNGRDTTGVPVTLNTSVADITSIVTNYYQEMIDRLRLPNSIADSVSQLGILNLSGLKTKGNKSATNNNRANYQARYSYVLDARSNQVYNEVTGQPLKVRYGALEKLYQQLRRVLMTPVLISYTKIRNDLLKQINDGEYTTSRNVAAVDLHDRNLTAQELAEQAARYTIDQLLGLVGKGQFDYEKDMYAKNLKDFNRMIRLDPSVRRYGGSRYRLLLKQTRHVYFWIYQSPFASHLKPGERSDIDNRPNAFMGTDPRMVTDMLKDVRTTHKPSPTELEDPITFKDNTVIRLMREQINSTEQFTKQTAQNVSEVAQIMEQSGVNNAADLTEVRKQVTISKHTASQAQELLVGIQPLETGVSQEDLLRITATTEKLRRNAMASLTIVNQAFYRMQMARATGSSFTGNPVPAIPVEETPKFTSESPFFADNTPEEPVKPKAKVVKEEQPANEATESEIAERQQWWSESVSDATSESNSNSMSESSSHSHSESASTWHSNSESYSASQMESESWSGSRSESEVESVSESESRVISQSIANQPDQLALNLDEAEGIITSVKNLKGQVDNTIRSGTILRREKQATRGEEYELINQVVTRLMGQKAEVDQLLATAVQANAEARLAAENGQRETALAASNDVLDLRNQMQHISQAVTAEQEQLNEYK